MLGGARQAGVFLLDTGDGPERLLLEAGRRRPDRSIWMHADGWKGQRATACMQCTCMNMCVCVCVCVCVRVCAFDLAGHTRLIFESV